MEQRTINALSAILMILLLALMCFISIAHIAVQRWMEGMRMAVKFKEQCKKCFHFQVCANVLQNDLFIREVMLGEKEPECKQFVEVVHGEWRCVGLDPQDPYFVCSCCKIGYSTIYHECEEMKYCPNCGAKMDGDGNGTT